MSQLLGITLEGREKKISLAISVMLWVYPAYLFYLYLLITGFDLIYLVVLIDSCS